MPKQMTTDTNLSNGADGRCSQYSPASPVAASGHVDLAHVGNACTRPMALKQRAFCPSREGESTQLVLHKHQPIETNPFAVCLSRKVLERKLTTCTLKNSIGLQYDWRGYKLDSHGYLKNISTKIIKKRLGQFGYISVILGHRVHCSVFAYLFFISARTH